MEKIKIMNDSGALQLRAEKAIEGLRDVYLNAIESLIRLEEDGIMGQLSGSVLENEVFFKQYFTSVLHKIYPNYKKGIVVLSYDPKTYKTVLVFAGTIKLLCEIIPKNKEEDEVICSQIY